MASTNLQKNPTTHVLPLSAPVVSAHNVALTHVPAFEVKVSAGTDKFAIGSLGLGVVATIAVVCAGAWVTDRSNRRLAKQTKDAVDAQRASELEQARAVHRAAGRQAWINALRDSLADFSASMLRMHDLYQQQLKQRSVNWPPPANSVDWQREEGLRLQLVRNAALADAERVCAKIKLLLVPEQEEGFARLVEVLDAAIVRARWDQMDLVASLCNDIVFYAQPILERESVKVHNLE